MKLGKWWARRGWKFILNRGIDLTNRYKINPSVAQQRIKNCVTTLANLGCAPTFPTPGCIVTRYPQFISSLQDFGAEIAIHSFDHIDLQTIQIPEAKEQLFRAVQAFKNFGLEVHGFRCPYLSCSEDLLNSLPEGIFDYSSNRAIQWDDPSIPDSRGLVFDTINRFYQPQFSQQTLSLPWKRFNMVEIPVCVPDDLQLHDGLNLDPAGIAQFWCKVLQETHQRGELFTLLFHPELGSLLSQSFEELFSAAKLYRPHIWIARLCDISDWWNEKSRFQVEMSPIRNGLHLAFLCSQRATILARGFTPMELGEKWDEVYYKLKTNVLEVSQNPRPFVGLSSNVPEGTVSFLLEQGYILDLSETSRNCGIYLDQEIIDNLKSQLELIKYIENLPTPLVRFWRWPEGARSALSITGDLDALSLKDYVFRLFGT